MSNTYHRVQESMPLLCISFFSKHRERERETVLLFPENAASTFKRNRHLSCCTVYCARGFYPLIGLLREFVSPSLVRMLAVFLFTSRWLRVCVCVCVRPQLPDRLQPVSSQDRRGTVNSRPSARRYQWPVQILLPSIDGSKLAMNPSVHSAVPEACQLA